jgi:hypothetical protein
MQKYRNGNDGFSQENEPAEGYTRISNLSPTGSWYFTLLLPPA